MGTFILWALPPCAVRCGIVPVMPDSDSEDPVTFSVRFPRSLYERLRHRAKLEERSIAALLRVAAKRYLNQTQEGK